MPPWTRGERVAHQAFGLGTVLDSDAHHTTVAFDSAGRRKFATDLVRLVAQSSNSTAVAAPSSAEQLLDLARRRVGDELSLHAFVAAMRRALPGPAHHHVGVTSGMRVQQFQNWLYDINPQHQLTDAQLLAVLRVEFPLASAELFTGDVDSGLRHIRSMRADYNRDGHNGPSPHSRGMPSSVSYGTF